MCGRPRRARKRCGLTGKRRDLLGLIAVRRAASSDSGARCQTRCYSLSRAGCIAQAQTRITRRRSVVVIEFADGMHEYVTTPVKRVLRLASSDVFYIETANSRYRLEVRDREQALEDVSSG